MKSSVSCVLLGLLGACAGHEEDRGEKGAKGEPEAKADEASPPASLRGVGGVEDPYELPMEKLKEIHEEWWPHRAERRNQGLKEPESNAEIFVDFVPDQPAAPDRYLAIDSTCPVPPEVAESDWRKLSGPERADVAPDFADCAEGTTIERCFALKKF